MNEMRRRLEVLNALACVAVSGVVTFLFYALAERMTVQYPQYTQVDTFAGMGFVFILSMIVSVSLVPSLIEKSVREAVRHPEAEGHHRLDQGRD